jgi:TatD DNase family protein
LPLFLHSRAAHKDFVQILREEGFGEDGGRKNGGAGGVVHSFTGTPEQVIEYVSSVNRPCLKKLTSPQMDMGFHISVNGCSLKTEDNLKAAKLIRPEFFLLETGRSWLY